MANHPVEAVAARAGRGEAFVVADAPRVDMQDGADSLRLFAQNFNGAENGRIGGHRYLLSGVTANRNLSRRRWRR